MQAGASLGAHRSVLTGSSEAKDDHAKFVLSLVSSSQKEIDRVALAHQEALLSSMAAGANEFPITHNNPYG